MRAIVREKYGGPENLQLAEVAKPDVVADGILVRVRAASLNRLEWYSLKGAPRVGRMSMGLLAPKQRVLGVDFAGTVEAIGADVTEFQVGDRVFGGRTGALAEYVGVREAVARMPANASFEEAASLPVAGLTALQGLRDHGRVQPGHNVLVNGASGGVGTFAVQIAKALGADVTAVCSTRNVESARVLGADCIVDYTREDFTGRGELYDVVFDVAGSKPWRATKRILKRDGILVQAGAPQGGATLGPIAHIAKVRLGAMRSSQKVVFFISKLNRKDLTVLGELVEAGKVKPFVERTYDLSEAADAFRYMGEGHARGKVVITVP